MEYSRELGINFWYEFDRRFNGMFNGDLATMVSRTGGLYDDFDANTDRTTGTLDVEKFKNAISSHNIFEEISTLGIKQLELMNPLIGEMSKPPLQSAFEDFGQGILYDREHDDQRTLRFPSGNPVIDTQTGNKMIFRIHTMDSPGSYQWWHAFIRPHVVLGGDTSKWFTIDKYVALSYRIFIEVEPKQAWQFPSLEVPENHPQSPTGPRSPDIVNKFRPILSAKNFDEIDEIFLNR